MQDNKNEYTEQDIALSLDDLSAVSGGVGIEDDSTIPVCPHCGSKNISKLKGPLYICGDGHKFPEPRYVKACEFAVR